MYTWGQRFFVEIMDKFLNVNRSLHKKKSVVENVTVSHHDEPLSISSLPPLAPLASCLDGRFYGVHFLK